MFGLNRIGSGITHGLKIATVIAPLAGVPASEAGFEARPVTVINLCEPGAETVVGVKTKAGMMTVPKEILQDRTLGKKQVVPGTDWTAEYVEDLDDEGRTTLKAFKLRNDTTKEMINLILDLCKPTS